MSNCIWILLLLYFCQGNHSCGCSDCCECQNGLSRNGCECETAISRDMAGSTRPVPPRPPRPPYEDCGCD